MPNSSKIEILRHSLAHVLAKAVLELFPGVKFGIGPIIENGFYYDFDLSCPLTLQDLPKIEKKMRELIKKDLKFEKKIISKIQAKKLFKNQPYKLELINELPDKKLTIFKTNNFIDLCQGPHIKTTKEINPDAFKLTKIAGAYWKGDEKKPMLQRIYGVAFNSKKELDEYLKTQTEAEKRDHRLLGKKLELFIFDDEIGAGLPLWLPKGAMLRRIIENYLFKELLNQGYQWLVTPHIANLKLWQTSGHTDFYKENMYSPIKIDEEEYQLKPMNCPFHLKIYQSKIRSWRDMPLYFTEMATVYRYEKSGVLHGLTRVRGFTQDDAHIFCQPKQLADELSKLLNSGLKILKTFGFKDYDVYLSTRPGKYIGTLKSWEKATKALEYALKKDKIKYQIDPEGGVFYGPKIDIKIKDSLGRPWQCTTIQVDFNLPEKFKITYIDQKGKKQQPIMIHRALLGSVERFIGVLLEHHAGALPVWLSPVQTQVIPVSQKFNKYGEEIKKQLQEENIRTELNKDNETLGKKIREGELQKIPYLLIVGGKEIKSNSVAVRHRKKGDLGPIKTEKFIEKIKEEIEKKRA